MSFFMYDVIVSIVVVKRIWCKKYLYIYCFDVEKCLDLVNNLYLVEIWEMFNFFIWLICFIIEVVMFLKWK